MLARAKLFNYCLPHPLSALAYYLHLCIYSISPGCLHLLENLLPLFPRFGGGRLWFHWGLSHSTWQINKQQSNWQEVMSLWWAGLQLIRGQTRQHRFHSSTKCPFLTPWPKEAKAEGQRAQHICRAGFHRKLCSSSTDKFHWRTKTDSVQCSKNAALNLDWAFHSLKMRLREQNLISPSPLFKLAARFSYQPSTYHMKKSLKDTHSSPTKFTCFMYWF